MQDAHATTQIALELLELLQVQQALERYDTGTMYWPANQAHGSGQLIQSSGGDEFFESLPLRILHDARSLPLIQLRTHFSALHPFPPFDPWEAPRLLYSGLPPIVSQLESEKDQMELLIRARSTPHGDRLATLPQDAQPRTNAYEAQMQVEQFLG